MPAAYTRSYSPSNGSTIYAGLQPGGFAGAVALDGVSVAGSFSGSNVPAWMTSIAVGQSLQLTGSTLSLGPNPDSYSGFAVDNDLNVWFAAAGGHSDGTNNAVARYPLGLNSPTGWVLARSASAGPYLGDAYLSDGRPAARHTYESMFYDADTNHLILVGCYAPAPGVNTYNAIDGFNITTGDWQPAGSYPFRNNAGSLGADGYNGGVVRNPATGKVFWTSSGSTWSWKPGESMANRALTLSIGRFPNCWDSARSAIFGLQWGDGQAGGSGVTGTHCANPDSGSPTIRAITFNSSSAYTAFQADGPAYGAMDFDPITGKFLFVHGEGATATFYEITPNAGTAWDMSAKSWSGSTGAVGNSGAVGKLKYISRGSVGGFIFYSSALYFLRTA